MKSNFLRRKRSLVDREIQIGFAWVVFGYLMFYTLFLILMLGVPIWWIYDQTDGLESAKLAAIGSFLIEDQRFWILLVIFIIMVTIHSVFVTRKFAGPIFVFRRALKRAQTGELTRVHLRQEDYFHDLKDMLNDHFSMLAETVKSMKDSVQKLDANLEKLDQETPGAHEGTIVRSLLDSSKQEIARINDLCGKSWHYTE